ncbi:NAD-dependent epimerase/dehydratase family protein [Aggregicoccus sp. 17bor-14]|uniref:NAD-dependent epimerase/dehydratase family protein n=1 Tax=Myxococcaceae TaxID=31 RepID=UPI00129C1616|nr:MULTISPECIES: NAD-dependent epimerase/dehydratase family protein [Myxococcaceae]MBF5043371.1 NAD-dependent epimerase/dehydratase family protein [Simulacricoccus sp. 17bor-14]MRI89129.1 NAD-dependent epimerase/dehydratase family protein [Aggregicoccus sp. 17bor-14]
MTKLSRRQVVQIALVAGAVVAAGCTAGKKSGAADAGSSTAAASAGSAQAKSAPLRILILGGTGFLGPELVEAAQARGHHLTLFNRGKTRPGLFAKDETIEKLQGDRDPKNAPGLEALKGKQWDAVIDTSGYVPRIVGASAELLAPNVKQYVFISTISVYADLSKPGMDESAPLATIADETNENVPENYGALKALCEKAAERAMPGRVTVIRPGLIVGPGDPTGRFTYWPLRVKRGGEVLAPGTGEDPAQVIDARDLAKWTIHMVEQKAMGTYNAVGPAQRTSMRQMLEQVKQGVPSDAHFTWVPAAFLEKQNVTPWQDMPMWIPAEGDTLGANTIISQRAIAQGLTFRPIAETARDTVTWFEGLPPEQQVKFSSRAGLKPEREQEVLKAWHAESQR